MVLGRDYLDFLLQPILLGEVSDLGLDLPIDHLASLCFFGLRYFASHEGFQLFPGLVKFLGNPDLHLPLKNFIVHLAAYLEVFNTHRLSVGHES